MSRANGRLRERPSRSLIPRRAAASSRSFLSGFLRGERGAVALESAVAIMVLVVGFGALVQIVHAVYTEDRMGRAARAAARALALDPAANACAPIRREFRLADDFDCATAWTLKVDLGVHPRSLPATLDADAAAGSGDMVLVRIGWSRERSPFVGFIQDTDADDDLGDGGDDEADLGPVPMVAIGLARCEAVLCGQEAS